MCGLSYRAGLQPLKALNPFPFTGHGTACNETHGCFLFALMPWPLSPVWPFELCSFQLRPLPLPSFLVSFPPGLWLLRSVTTSIQGQEGAGTGTLLALLSPPDSTSSVTRTAQWLIGQLYSWQCRETVQNELQQAGPKKTGLPSSLACQWEAQGS